MKYLLLLVPFYCSSIFAQAVDCQLLNKATPFMSNKNLTMRMHTSSVVKDGKIENTMEVDSARNFKSTILMPKRIYHLPTGDKESLNKMEVLFTSGMSYTKSNIDTVWSYQKMPAQDSTMAKTFYDLYANTKFEDCQKIGTDVLDGKNYDIVEARLRMKGMMDSTKARVWVDFTDNVIRKMEYVFEVKAGNGQEAHTMNAFLEYGVAVSIQKPKNAVPQKPLPPVDRTIPQYKDGVIKMFAFMKSNLVYPQTGIEMKKEGTVYVKFTVDIDGSVCDIKVSRGLGFGCDEAVIKLIQQMPNWESAQLNGVPTESLRYLEFRFNLL